MSEIGLPHHLLTAGLVHCSQHLLNSKVIVITVLIYTARIGLLSPFTPAVGYYYYYGQPLKLY
jgi:hypothetical protein